MNMSSECKVEVECGAGEHLLEEQDPSSGFPSLREDETSIVSRPRRVIFDCVPKLSAVVVFLIDVWRKKLSVV